MDPRRGLESLDEAIRRWNSPGAHILRAHIRANLAADTGDVEIIGLAIGDANVAREMMPRLPFNEIDLLIVDEMGKNISGTGMDPNVTGRNRDILGTFPTPVTPKRLFVRDLTPDSNGNATGIGLADLTTKRGGQDQLSGHLHELYHRHQPRKGRRAYVLRNRPGMHQCGAS